MTGFKLSEEELRPSMPSKYRTLLEGQERIMSELNYEVETQWEND